MHRLVVIVLVCWWLVPGWQLFSVDKKELLNKVRDYRKNNEHAIMAEFLELLSIPNVALDRINIRKNAGPGRNTIPQSVRNPASIPIL